MKKESPKTKLMKKANKLWKQAVLSRNPRCEVCGSTYGLTAHHFFPRSSAGHMIYLVENGCSLCQSCHFKHHFTFNPTIHHKITVRRGEKWYNKLEKISKEEHASYRSVEYYKDNIQRLEELINKYGER